MLDLDELEAKARSVGQGVLLFDGAKLYAGTTISLIRELREARAVIAKALSWDDRGTPIRDVLREAVLGEVEQAVAAEREACAHSLEVRAALYTKNGTVAVTIASCAAFIRARGAKGGEKC